MSSNTSQKCTYCDGIAIVRLPYARLKLCKDHFIQYLETKVANFLSEFNLLKNVKKLAIAVSGGKDSLALLHILSKLKNFYKIELVAVTIDLGIENYSKYYVNIVRKNCEKLGVNLKIVSLEKEFEFTIDDVKRFEKELRKPICSICGLVKRYLLNKVGYELNVDAIATGHNLNDIAQFILTSYIHGDLHQLTKLTPYIPRIGRAITKIKPFYLIPENEIKLYVEVCGIEVCTKKCPYTPREGISKKQPFQEYLRTLLTNLELNYPGTLHNLVMSYFKKIQPILSNYVREDKFKECKICGMPTISDVCSFCKLREKILRLKQRH